MSGTRKTYRSVDARWWVEDKANSCGGMVSTVARHIRTRSNYRFAAHMQHAKMYAGATHGAGVFLRPRGAYQYVPSTMPRNVCRMGADTGMTKVSTHRPLPQVLSDHGDWGQQKRARLTTKYLEGDFYQSQIFEDIGPLLDRDSSVFGFGVSKEVIEGDVSRTERVHPWELLVDDWDARYGKPRNLYQVRTIDLGEALCEFGEPRDDDDGEEDAEVRCKAIELAATNAPSAEWDWQGEADCTVERVRIVEAWHLCDNRIAHAQPEVPKHDCNGCHVITLLDAKEPLLREAWDWDRFPFAVLNYSEPLAGFFGMGLVEMLEGWQYAINEQYEKVEEGHRMLGGGIILNSNDSQIVETDFNNGVVPIITHAPGKPPQFVTPNPIHPAVYQREREMPQDALAEFGYSPQATQAVKPAGLDSGKALMEWDEIEDQRHLPRGRRYEKWAQDVARIKILAARQIARNEGEKSVQVVINDGLLPLKWSDVSLQNFQLRVFPASMLPQSKAAKVNFLDNMFDKGLIDKATYFYQLGGPDPGAELDLETADRLNIDEKLESVLYADEGTELDRAARQCVPSPYQDFRWFQKRAQQKYNWAELRGADEANLEVLRDVMAQCQTLIERDEAKQTAAQPPMSPIGLGAMGAPMPPPGGSPGLPIGSGMPPLPNGGSPPNQGPPPMGMPPMPMPMGNA